jgi:formate dehydrogenase maturation protein FdhE
MLMDEERVTIETCPVCGEEARCEHGIQEGTTKRLIHHWDCPICGEEWVFPLDCEICNQSPTHNQRRPAR